MQLLIAYENDESQRFGKVFNKAEIECLKELGQKFEQKKTQLKNTNSSKRLSWATWIIARLVGWKGATKQRPPGRIIMKKGLEKLILFFMIENWQSYCEMSQKCVQTVAVGRQVI